MFDLSEKEISIFKKLNTPVKIQDFLEKIPINFDDSICMSPRRVLRERKAQCLEGALFAAAALWFHGGRPLIFDLKSINKDQDHVAALFKQRGCWGAISKTNHAVLRYREPVYRNIRELAMSYFHEYFLDNGEKTMRSFSKPFDLRRFRNRRWVTSEEELFYIAEALDNSPHISIIGPRMSRRLRPADPIEIKAGKLTEWRKPYGKT